MSNIAKKPKPANVLTKKVNPPKRKDEITENDLKNTHFVPMKRMHQVIEMLEPTQKTGYNIRCDYNIVDLKHERNFLECYDDYFQRYSSKRHNSLFISSCYKAIYAHDWNRLLFILKRIPRWRFPFMNTLHMRMLTLLLMYHPDSQEKGYLGEYLHMVWGCRLDQDKKAILKTILTLNKKLYRRGKINHYCRQDELKRKEAFIAMAEKNDN